MMMTILVLSSLTTKNRLFYLYTKLASVSDPTFEYIKIKMHIECTFSKLEFDAKQLTSN